MKKKHLIFKSINLFLSISLALLFTKCGSFQGSSYFDSDGIYFSESKSSLEKTNARYLKKDQFEELIDVMVCDVSFISLKKVIEPNLHLLKDKSVIIALIKPQFESKKNETKKGVVKDSTIHQRICNEITEWFKTKGHTKILSIIESPIKGPKGNTEFLITVKYQK